MNLLRLVSAATLTFVAVSALCVFAEAAPLRYPAARRGDQTDVYHGVTVADPYRWMEDVDSTETKAWVAAENHVTADYLAGCRSREAIRRRITRLIDRERFSAPLKEGGRYFYQRNPGLQDQDVLYVADGLAAPARMLLDPNPLSPDGSVAVNSWTPSHDGRLLAYALSHGGSDWLEWHVRDVNTGKDLADLLKWSKASNAVWTHDSQGFFYERFAEPAAGQELTAKTTNQSLCYHRLGTPQAEDVLVYQRPDHPDWYLGAWVTDDGRYLMIGTNEGTDPKSCVFVKDLKDPQHPAIAPADSPVTDVLTAADAAYTPFANEGPVFWVLTDKDAPLRRIIRVDLRSPAPANWREIVPEAKEALDDVNFVGGHIIARYSKDAHSLVRVFSPEGKAVREVALPDLGSAEGFVGKPDDAETFYFFTSFTNPGTVYRYDVATGKSTVFRQPTMRFRPEDFETKQVFYASHDGTRVPMFIVHRKGLPLDGRNPTYLYGYGGFGEVMSPSYSSPTLAWLQMGGVYALANIRGGGEYGETWHEAAEKTHRQKGFDDFIAAAEWLIRNHYTTPRKLAIAGESNGGLLVGACLTQRPHLFGAAIVGVGVLDMLRFPKSTLGWGWIPEYGNPDDPAEFAALYAYSPLHHLRPNTSYPATLILTGDHDDRVAPWHSFKFAATMQADQSGDRPVLIRVETQVGHGGDTGIVKTISEYTDRLAFLARELGMEDKP